MIIVMVKMVMEVMIKMDFSRQNRIFNPDQSKINVTILGAGSTGSFIAFVLAKMGIKEIKVVDFDKVEAHNIPNQYYRLKDVGKAIRHKKLL